MGMRVFGGDGAHGLPQVIRRQTAIAELGSEPVGNRRFARHRRTTNKNDTWVTHTALRAKRAEDAHAGASTSNARHPLCPAACVVSAIYRPRYPRATRSQGSPTSLATHGLFFPQWHDALKRGSVPACHHACQHRLDVLD